MTLCIAWKTKESAFILADSIVTDYSGVPKSVGVTTFGEVEICEGKTLSVYENAYKLFRSDKLIISLVGDLYSGGRFINVFLENLKFNFSIKETLEMTVNNFSDFREFNKFEVVLIFFIDDEPKIILLSNKSEQTIQFISDIVVLGSAQDIIKETIQLNYRSFYKTWDERESALEDSERVFFMRMYALIQNYGQHFYTLESGFGGAYTGFIFHKGNIQEHPKTCFIISKESIALSTDDIVYVSQTENQFGIVTSSDIKVLTSFCSMGLPSNAPMLDNFVQQVANEFDRGKFEFIVFLNKTKHISCIVHMKNNLKHAFLQVDVRDGLEGVLGFSISKDIESFLNNGYSRSNPDAIIVFFIPYVALHSQIENVYKKYLPRLRLERGVNRADSYVYKGFLGKFGDRNLECFYLYEDMLTPFINHYLNRDYFIVDYAEDSVVFEYQSGVVIFPENFNLPKESLVKLNAKNTNENIYVFELVDYPENITIKVLSSSYEESFKKLEKQLLKEGIELISRECIFFGIEFYHQDYTWKSDSDNEYI